MRMIIHGRHLELTEPIRLYAEKKVGRIKKYFNNIMEVDVTLSAVRLKTVPYHHADVLVYINGHKIKASSTDEDLYAAIDEVVDVLETQITKYKEKLRDDKHTGAVKRVKYNPVTKTVEKEALRRVVDTTVSPKPMDLEEAILQLEVMNMEFYIFMNAKTEEMNVIYKRRDGDYGHVVPGWK